MADKEQNYPVDPSQLKKAVGILKKYKNPKFRELLGKVPEEEEQVINQVLEDLKDTDKRNSYWEWVGYLTDEEEGDDKLDYEVVNDKSLDAIKDNFTPPGAKSQEENVPGENYKRYPSFMKKKIDTNDNGKIEKDEMADFQKSLDDYACKNKKGRDDIPATYKR